MANADTPSGRIDEIKTTNSINLTGLKNNDMVEVEVSVLLPDNGFEQRATDFVRISTPYSKFTTHETVTLLIIQKFAHGRQLIVSCHARVAMNE